jgi:hypothetical protein
MKIVKRSIALGGALCLASSLAVAADLANLSGQSCGDDDGVWHFINNQTGGAQLAGTINALFTSGLCTVDASKVNNNTQHFFCAGYSGTLLGASTNLPGRLVLSDFTCTKKDEEPPKK